ELVGRTAVMMEFTDEAGEIRGDTQTTTNISNHYQYDLVYDLSKETTRMFHEAGFDTSVGSDDFHFYYADYYEAPWKHDNSVDVTVTDEDHDGGIEVRVAGLTKDLPGALGGKPSASSVSSSSSGSKGCLIERTAGDSTVEFLRDFRDLVLHSAPGRLVTSVYYTLH
ncbi:MAG: hypothetical protein ABEJ65_04565, partial [bacterium]